MDCHRGSGVVGGDVVEFHSGNSENAVNENRRLGSIDAAVWATEDGVLNKENSVDKNLKSNCDGTLFPLEEGIEPSKERARESLLVDLMDHCHRGSGVAGGNVVEFHSGNSKNDITDNLGLRSIDPSIWATEDGMLNKENSVDNNLKSNHDVTLFPREVGSEPPKKRAREALLADVTDPNPAKAIGKMFYKTKLCSKLRAGTCPFMKNNCYYAHSVEEVRKPPPNWQKIVAALKEELPESSEPREVYQIPIVGFSDEARESNMRQLCRDFLTKEGCSYGENCSFVHDERSKDRKSMAICLVPGNGGGYGSNGSKSTLNISSHSKSRGCHRWELTGYY